MGCLNGEGVIGKHLMGREKIALAGCTVEIDEERERERIEERKQNEFNEKKKKKNV